MAKKKRSCKKGYGCGGSCISVTYMCRKQFPAGISVSIDGARRVILTERTTEKDKDLDSRITKVNIGDMVIYGYTPKPAFFGNLQQTEVVFSKDGENKRGKINFKVNDDFNAPKELTKKEKIEAARSVDRMVKRLLRDDLEEGTVINVTAWTGDGKGDSRIRAYRRAGFQSSEYSDSDLYAIVKNGKFVGATNEQYARAGGQTPATSLSGQFEDDMRALRQRMDDILERYQSI